MGVFIHGYQSGSPWPRVTRALVTPAAVPVMTIAEAKPHCRIDIDDENALIVDWIAAATRKVEQDTGSALLTQTWDIALDAFPFETFFQIPLGPVQSVTSVSYIDTAGVTQAWPGSNYLLSGGRLSLTDTAVWPTDVRGFGAVVLRVVVGYTSAALIPADLRHAVRLVVAWLSEHREPQVFEQDVYNGWIGAYRTVLVA